MTRPPDVEPALRAAFEATPLRDVQREVARALDGNPRLRVLDGAITAVRHADPDPEAPSQTRAQVEIRANQIVREVIQGRIPEPESIRESREVLRLVRFRLLETEQKELRSDPTLDPVRAMRHAFESLDRFQGYRMSNQLLSLHGEEAALVEIPVGREGRKETIPVRGALPGRGHPVGFSRALGDPKLLRIRTFGIQESTPLQIRDGFRPPVFEFPLGEGCPLPC